MPLTNKYLKYSPEITLEVFTLVCDKLFSIYKNAGSIEDYYTNFKGNWGILFLDGDVIRTRGHIPANCTETTVQEILGYDPFLVKKFVLPRRWCCKTNEESLVDLSRFIRCNGYPYHPEVDQFVHWPFTQPNSSCFFEVQKGYTEITFEQFKKYVLKESIETPKEVLKKALYNNGVLIGDNQGDGYVQNQIDAQNRVEQAEKELAAHKKTMTFLEEQYSLLKAE